MFPKFSFSDQTHISIKSYQIARIFVTKSNKLKVKLNKIYHDSNKQDSSKLSV